MPSPKRSNVPLYVRIAETFTRQVASGVLRPGDRVPSLRKLCREQGVSLSTALQSYVWLENRGYSIPQMPRDIWLLPCSSVKLSGINGMS